MKKTITIKDQSVRYLADVTAENTSLLPGCVEGGKFVLPNGILSKGLTGCGGTYLALTDKNPCVILSPRIKLIENKGNQEQHHNALVVCGRLKYCHNMAIDRKLSEKSTSLVRSYLAWCETKGIVPKILTTYDSFINIAGELPLDNKTYNHYNDCVGSQLAIHFFNNWRIVVDEFQQLLLDSTFKAGISEKVLKTVVKFPYVTYLSATPIPDDLLSAFQLEKLPYYEIIWEHAKKQKILVYDTTKCASPRIALKQLIQRYQAIKAGAIKPDTAVNAHGEIVENREAVFFVNSVTEIINILHECNIPPEDCTIIVSDNPDNISMVNELSEKLGYEKSSLYASTNPKKRLTKGYRICHHIPLKGKQHTLFTFCTSTAYMGVDFYSTNAKTYIVSNLQNPVCSVDIVTELPQIVGRQRLKDINPWANEACLIVQRAYKWSIKKETERVRTCRDEAKKQLNDALKAYSSVGEEYAINNLRNAICLYPFEGWTSFLVPTETGVKYKFSEHAEIAHNYRLAIVRKAFAEGIPALIDKQKSIKTDTVVAFRSDEEKAENAIARKTFKTYFQELCTRYETWYKKRAEFKAEHPDMHIYPGFTMPEAKLEELFPDGEWGVKYTECYCVLAEVKFNFELCRDMNFDKNEILAWHKLKHMSDIHKAGVAYMRQHLLNKTFESKAEIKDIMQIWYDQNDCKITAKTTHLKCWDLKIKKSTTRVAGQVINAFKVENV